MARPAKLPLPADQEVELLRRAAMISQELDNPAFLDQLLPQIEAITGTTFGAGLIRQLLTGVLWDAAGGRSPAQRTVNAAVQRHAAQKLRSGGSSNLGALDTSVEVRSDGERPSPPEVTPDSIGMVHRALELAELNRLEIDRERKRADVAESQLSDLRVQLQVALANGSQANARLSAREEAYALLQQVNEDLRSSLQLAVDRAASENRQNMLRVDRMRQEARALEEQLRLARLEIEESARKLRDEKQMCDELRHRVNSLRDPRSTS